MRSFSIRAVLVALTAIVVGSCTEGEIADPSRSNQEPSVALSAPVHGASGLVNTPITLSATATDADGTVTEVEFFDGLASIGTDLTSPYDITWTPLTTGAHMLSARATDNSDAVKTSPARSFIVTSPPANQAPTVALTAPATGASALVNTPVTVSATASDADGDVSVVEFLDGTTPIGTDGSSPYSISWTPTTAGTHTLTARATDNDHAVTTSASRPITVSAQPPANQPPTVALTAPGSGASALVNTSITVSATAGDADGTVTLVEFFDGTTSVGTDATSPYSITWTPTTAGARSLTARATDNSSAVTTSAARSFTVTAQPPPNQAPTVALTAPANGGSALVNTAITVSATASDADGTVTLVEFFDGTTSIGTDASSPYGITWRPAVTGAHTLTARVTDNATAVTTSAARSFTVMPQPPPGGSVTFVGAGDIAECISTNDEATAALLDGIAGTVFTLGDNVYLSGTATEFANCYDPSWGRHKSRTRPVAGNHDYKTSGATGYYDYFGAAAGPRGKGYYSFDLGGWHIIILNSNIARDAASEQIAWLRADLVASGAKCTMALWHHPRFSSGSHGNDASQQPFWDVLYELNADVVLVGHDHNYERFAPQTPSGAADATRGIRQFVVGTGGTSLRAFSTIRANSEFRNSTTWGVIKFDLAPTGYSWSYVTTANGAVADSGSGSCH